MLQATKLKVVDFNVCIMGLLHIVYQGTSLNAVYGQRMLLPGFVSQSKPLYNYAYFFL